MQRNTGVLRHVHRLQTGVVHFDGPCGDITEDRSRLEDDTDDIRQEMDLNITLSYVGDVTVLS